MSYQAVIRNASNDLVSSTTVGMQISIIQGSAGGTAVFVETHTPVSNANGLISLEIGNGTASVGTFASINWANGPYFIKTESDPTGGTSYTITGTSQLLSVPYAMHAKSATTANSASTATNATTAQNIPSGRNMQPYQAINYIIALDGVFPSRGGSSVGSGTTFLGEIKMFGGNFAPSGYAFCDGQLLPIASYNALFSILGTTYGGYGRTTFGLPDLRGRAPVHSGNGNGPGLTLRRLGVKGGIE